MIAAARADPRDAVMRPSSESSVKALRSRRTSLSVMVPAATRPVSPLCEPEEDWAEQADTVTNTAATSEARRRERLYEGRMSDGMGSSGSSRTGAVLNIRGCATRVTGECPYSDRRRVEHACLLRV